VLTKLDANGSKNTTYVPTNGLVMAVQQKDSQGHPTVRLVQRDASGLQEDGQAYDPFGNLISNVQPPVGGPPGYTPTYGPPYGFATSSSFINANNFGTGCQIDGVAQICSKLWQAMGSMQIGTISISGPGAVDVGGLGIVPERETNGDFSSSVANYLRPVFGDDPQNSYAGQQKKKLTPMEIAKRKNCATPNSIVETFKTHFEELWDKTVASGTEGTEGEENGEAIFYDPSNNTYPEVQFSQGVHLRSRTSYGPTRPALPRAMQELEEAVTKYSNATLLVVFHTHPDFIGGESRSNKPTKDGDEDFISGFGGLGIIRSGSGYGFYINGENFGPDSPLANECIRILMHPR
jgi:hypothetical protein